MVDAKHCLDRVVPEGMSQVWRRLEVGNHKRRILNTRLSSGTSEHTSSSSRNVPGRMIRSDLFWYWNKIRIRTIGTRTYRINFSEGSGPPLLIRLNRFFHLGKNRNRSNQFFAIFCYFLLGNQIRWKRLKWTAKMYSLQWFPF